MANPKDDGATPEDEDTHSGECMNQYRHKWQWLDFNNSSKQECTTCGETRTPEGLRKG